MVVAFFNLFILYSQLMFLAWCIRSGRVFATKCVFFIQKLFSRNNIYSSIRFSPPLLSQIVTESTSTIIVTPILTHPSPLREERSRIVEHLFVRPVQEFDFIVSDQWHIVRFADCAKIGLVIDVIDCEGDFVFCVDILMDASAFFTFPTRLTKQYLIDLAEDGEDDVILARDLELALGVNGLSDVLEPRIVLHTHWIRIVQRRWKRVFAERKRRLRMRGSILVQRRFELTGKYGVDTSTKGILRDFAICPGSTNTKIG